MNVLLVRFGSLGDVVLTLAAVAGLRQAQPDARITFLVKRAWAPLVAGQSGVDEVWTLEPDASAGELRRRVHAATFDVAVDWQTSPRSRALLAGHPRVLAWKAERWARRRLVSLRWTRPAPVRPAWLRYADALAPLGVAADGLEPPRFVPAAAAMATAEAFHGEWARAAGAAPVVALAPGARWATKRWPAGSFAAVARARRAAGERVLWVGDSADRARWRAEAGAAAGDLDGGDPGSRWFEGGLAETAAALSRARVVLANDSGLLHLAGAVGSPVVGVYASTDPRLGFPPAGPAGPGRQALVRGLACQPCTLHGRERCPLGHHRCAREIAPGHVLALLDPVPGAVAG